jgi:hypothetical protein
MDCDGNPANGCEPLTSLIDCGSCGAACSIAHGSGTCASQSCKVANCNSGWDDCDGDPSNGCERNVQSPANGGLGPCLPDTGCTRQSYGGHDYFFCPTKRSWDDARTHCQQQLLGELVHVGDAAENAFVQAHVGDDSWLGGNDVAVAGTWRWSDDASQFWVSGATPSYANWASGEPNNGSGNEQCAQMYTSGLWDDRACADQLAFVCEIDQDSCPNDSSKIDPGQCGCGIADTDTDSDGTADCNDGCPSDPAKTSPGTCGCGVAESATDTDGDGTPDCKDGCPNDATKTAPGACGCGIADTDGGTGC